MMEFGLKAPSENKTQPGDGPRVYPEDTINGLVLTFNNAVKQIQGISETQQVAILALTVLQTLQSETTRVKPEQLAILVQTLTQNHPESERMRERIAAYVSMVVGLSQRLRDILAKAEQA